MSAFSALLASLLAAWPAPVAADAGMAETAPMSQALPPARQDDGLVVWARLSQAFRDDDAAQVRIEQQIIWRVSPMPRPARESLMAIDPLPPSAPRMIERNMGECIPMSAIAGGQPQRGSRLLLFLRDRRMVAADLEKACSARDFYSGFYVDKPNADGRLCVTRDRILARSGARCQISKFRLLIADDD